MQMSTVPKASVAALTSSSAAPSLVRSPAKTAVSPLISLAVCSATSASRSLISTFAPSATNISAVARPIPRADPVTIAAFPSRSPITPPLLRFVESRRGGYRERAVLVDRPVGSGQADAAILGHGPVRVVCDLPWVAVGVDEDAAVAAPEGLRRLAADPRAGGAGFFDHGVDLGGGAEVERQSDAAPAAAVLDAAVLGEAGPVPERDDHLAGLEEDDVVAG